MIDVLRIRRGPWRDVQRPDPIYEDRLAEEPVGPSRDRNANPIDLQAMQSLEARVDHAVVSPAEQPKRGRSVEEIVLSSSFPNEMPRMLGIESDGSSSPARNP